MEINLITADAVVVERSLDRYEVVDIDGTGRDLALRLRDEPVALTVSPLVARDRGRRTIVAAYEAEGLDVRPIERLNMSPVRIVGRSDGDLHEAGPSPTEDGCVWGEPPAPTDLTVVANFPGGPVRFGPTEFAQLPASTIVVPSGARVDFFEMLGLLPCLPAIAFDEDAFCRAVGNADPRDGLRDLLVRCRQAPSIVVVGRNQVWAILAGHLETFAVEEVVPERRLPRFLVAVADQVAVGQSLSTAIRDGLKTMAPAPSLAPVGMFNVVSRLVHAATSFFWTL